MKIYEIISGYFELGKSYFPTIREAKKEAQIIANHEDDVIDVDRVEITPGRAGIIALANQRGWVKSRERVFTAHPRQRNGGSDL